MKTKQLEPVAPRCPQCKRGTLSLIEDGLVGHFYLPGMSLRTAEPELRMEPRPFFACNACEFCLEVQ